MVAMAVIVVAAVVRLHSANWRRDTCGRGSREEALPTTHRRAGPAKTAGGFANTRAMSRALLSSSALGVLSALSVLGVFTVLTFLSVFCMLIVLSVSGVVDVMIVLFGVLSPQFSKD